MRCRHSNRGLGHRLEVLPAICPVVNSKESRLRCVSLRPAYPAVDEPTGNLDTENSRRVLDLLLAGRAESKAWSSSPMSPISRLAATGSYTVDGMLVSPELTRPKNQPINRSKNPLSGGGMMLGTTFTTLSQLSAVGAATCSQYWRCSGTTTIIVLVGVESSALNTSSQLVITIPPAGVRLSRRPEIYRRGTPGALTKFQRSKPVHHRYAGNASTSQQAGA